MATWVKCTSPEGSTLYVNFDNVTLVQRNDDVTEINFIAEDEIFEIKETIDELKANGLKL